MCHYVIGFTKYLFQNSSTMSTANKNLMIKDKVFDKRGPIPENVLKELSIRGDATHVSDCLSRHGWDGKELVACPIVTTEVTTGKIKGSRWSVNGDLASYKIKAQSIWAEAKKDVQIQIGNNNLDLLCWGESPQWVNACNPPPPSYKRYCMKWVGWFSKSLPPPLPPP